MSRAFLATLRCPKCQSMNCQLHQYKTNTALLCLNCDFSWRIQHVPSSFTIPFGASVLAFLAYFEDDFGSAEFILVPISLLFYVSITIIYPKYVPVPKDLLNKFNYILRIFIGLTAMNLGCFLTYITLYFLSR